MGSKFLFRNNETVMGVEEGRRRWMRVNLGDRD